ncbi:MAG: VPLPA-CTERM sorting domain-containing protein [Pseudomonadota bacterium]
MPRQFVLASLLAASLLLILANPVHAQIVENGLIGNTDYDGWDGLGSVPGYGFGTAWATPLTAFEAGSGDAALDRIAGTHYSASVSLYSFSSNTDFSVIDESAISGLETVVFSIQTWLAGDEITGPVALAGLPQLSHDGTGPQNLAADFDFFSDGGPPVFFAGSLFETVVYTFQWDLTDLGITEFNIDWNHQVHSGVIALQLEQSDTFSLATATVVPLPAAAWMLMSGLLGLVAIRRRSATI